MPSYPPEEVRDDYIPRADYLDREFHELEKTNLWPKVWQVACRPEDIPEEGDFYVYDICDDSVIVTRGAGGKLHAYHNFCTHRGTRLADGQGNVKQFTCPFHGWKFGLDGANVEVVDRQDWGGCLSAEDTDLVKVQVGEWGGWIWINMDPDCQPLMKFLSPMAEMCELFEFEKLRPAWYKTSVVEANWKTTLHGFTEFYHVQTTHSQMLTYTQDYSISRAMGRHGWMSYSGGSGLPVGRSNRLPPKEIPDFRELLFEYAEQFKHDLAALQTERAYQATQRLRTETTADTPPEEVIGKWAQFIYEAAIESGAGWPDKLTPEYIAESGFDWAVFPNTVFLHPAIEAVLWYRLRPYKDDHNRSVMEVWSLERFPPGEEPDVVEEYVENWQDGDYPLIYRQDYQNIPRVHQGMKSSAFKGLRPSPIQERAVAHHHRMLRSFMQDPHADDNLGKEPLVDVPDAE